MLGSFFSSKEHPTYNLANFKLFDTKYNNLPCTKITLKNGSPGQYEILKTTSHPNMLPIFKISQHSVYTKRIVPLSPFVDKTKTEYNRYIISRIKDSLEYVHTVLKREHRAISIDSIFLEESGKVLLGNLEKSIEFQSSDIDDEMCNALSLELTGINTSSLDTDSESIFDLIFGVEVDALSTQPPQNKISIFGRILQNRTDIPKHTIKYIFQIFIKDLKKEEDKPYKISILDNLYELDSDYFCAFKKDLFSVIDSAVRLHILEMYGQYDSSLDDIYEDLSLGLRVKDKVLKKKTVEFIFKNTIQFSTQPMGGLIISMQLCTDLDTINTVCAYLIDFNREDVYKPIYKLLHSLLTLGKNSLLIYKCIDKYFPYFDKSKIARDILPVLCVRLIEKENQEYCFSLVEKIIDFLRNNRNEIHGKDWPLNNIKSIFMKKPESKDNFEERMSQMCKDELNDWEEQDL